MKYNKKFTLCSHNSDFEPRIRDSVIDYMVRRFGEEYVSAIGTYGITRTKVAIQDTARVFGIPPGETISLTKNVLSDIDDDASLEELEKEYPELKKYFDKWEAEGKNLRYFVKGIRNSHRQFCLSKETKVNLKDDKKEIQFLNPEIDKIEYLDSKKNIKYTSNFELINTGKQIVFKIELEDGKFIRATENHLIFTERGPIKVKDLNDNDKIYTKQ